MAYASLDENEKCLIKQGELADLRLVFPVTEKAAARKSLKEEGRKRRVIR
jgi:hypothetical protein